MNERLAQLYREAGLQPAWQRTPEAQPGYTPPRPRPRQMRPAIQRLYDPNQGVRDQAGAQVRQERELAALSDRAMGGYSGYADRNQVEEFGRGAMEMTGAPAWARGIQDVQNGRPGEAIPEFLWGALNTAGIAALPLGGGARPATPPRVPRDLPSRLRVPEPIPSAVRPQRPPATASPDAGQSGAGNRVVYRGLNRPYDPANGGYYQSFTSSLDDAREYGPNVIAAHINPGRNLAIDGGGNNFNALSVEQLSADVRARLHPSVGASATTDQIAHAAREAGYDSVTVRNVHDNRWGERPVRGAEPRTIDFVFDTANIRPLDNIPPQASEATRSAEKVKLTAADRALLDELGVADAPDGGASGAGQTFYRGVREGDALSGEGPIYLHRDPSKASEYAGARFDASGRPLIETTGEGGNVARVTANIRNPIEVSQQEIAALGYEPYRIREMMQRGYDAAIAPNGEVLVFDRNGVRPAIGRAPDAPNSVSRTDGGASGAGQRIIVPRRSELDRIVADTRRAHPEANAEDVSAIRWVRDAQGNYHFASAMDADHQALLTRLERQGVEVPAQTKENRHLRGHFFRDENGQWRSTDMNGQDGPLPTANAPNAGPSRPPPRPRPPPRRPQQ